MIVEIIIVIIIIGILVTLTIVAYSRIQQQARDKTVWPISMALMVSRPNMA